MSEPRVEIFENLPTGGQRSIGPRDRLTARLVDRRDDIEAAIRTATEIVAAVPPSQPGPFALKTIEVTFGITLSAEAGVIVSKAAAEASLEVKLTVERTGAE